MAKSNTIQLGIQYRTLELDRAAMDAEKRTLELAFSSEMPVERFFGYEILDHSKEAVDLSRLNNGGALLVEHDTRDQVGVVESARIDPDRKGRAVVRFGTSARAQEIFKDVQDGIRRLVSVGYRIGKMVAEKVDKDVETLRATNWTPLEISIVSVPADASVGIGRAEDKNKFEVEVKRMSEPVLEQPKPIVQVVAEPKEDKRATEIRAIASRIANRVPSITEQAEDAIVFGKTVEEFRKEALEQLPKVQPARPAEPLDIKPKEWQRYSLTRALRLQLPGAKRDGFEAEVDQEIAMKSGARAEGLWVPREAMITAGQRNFVAGTGTLGGMLVQTDNLSSQFIELLRNRAKTQQLGARVINLSNPVTIPRQNAAGSVNWVGETVAATLSTGNFTQITLTPQGLSAFQQYGKQLLFESDPSIDALIRDDIMQILALEIDRVVLHGTGSSQPTGITATTGVTTIALGANGSAFTVANGRSSLVSLETAVATSNADVGSLAYLTNAKMRGRLKMIDQNLTTSAADWVWKGGPSGEVNGYRAEVSNQVSAAQTQGTATTICSSVFFGNWNEVLVASFNNGATDLVVDPYTLAVNGVVRVIARHWVDIGIRHGQSFAVLLGALDS